MINRKIHGCLGNTRFISRVQHDISLVHSPPQRLNLCFVYVVCFLSMSLFSFYIYYKVWLADLAAGQKRARRG